MISVLHRNQDGQATTLFVNQRGDAFGIQNQDHVRVLVTGVRVASWVNVTVGRVPLRIFLAFQVVPIGSPQFEREAPSLLRGPEIQFPPGDFFQQVHIIADDENDATSKKFLRHGLYFSPNFAKGTLVGHARTVYVVPDGQQLRIVKDVATRGVAALRGLDHFEDPTVDILDAHGMIAEPAAGASARQRVERSVAQATEPTIFAKTSDDKLKNVTTQLLVVGCIEAALAAFMLMIWIGMAAPLGEMRIKDPNTPHPVVLQAVCAFGLVRSCITIFGAWQMRKRESYGLATLTAALTAIPVGGCCLLGLPFGIGSLIVLQDPDVKRLFSQRSQPSESADAQATGQSTISAAEKASVACPHCHKKMKVPVALLGKKGKCKGCDQVIVFRAAASAKAQPLSWTREGQSHDERLRAEHGGFGEMKAILNIDDFGRSQNPSEFRVLASSLSFNNGVLSGYVPGDLTANKTCHVCATVGEHQDDLTTFRTNIEGGKMFLRSCFHKYPQYPLIHLSIMLPLDTAADLTKVRATVVEQVVNYVNADFQDWVHGLSKTSKTLVHIYRPDQQRFATGTADVDPSFVNDLVQAMNDAEAALQKIAISKRDYSAAVNQFFRDHPEPFFCPMRKK